LKIVIVSFGHKRDELFQAALDDFCRRIQKPWSIELRDLASGRKSNDENAEVVMRRELEAFPLESAVVLDVQGKAHTSESFAAFLQQQQDGGTRELPFVIGGADGVHPDGRKRARYKLSLGAMTLPHRLARIVLVEQIYRAQSILRGEKYHRA
jgi:23S rRNA (pseudouridine1915-N3)-methyltransferase